MPLRYSPKRIEDYNVLACGVQAGPGNSRLLLDDVEAWNLAFLSHPFEHKPEHPDAKFTTLVRRTANTLIATGACELPTSARPELMVRGWLLLPAGQFLMRLTSATTQSGDRLLKHLPLYKVLGDGWVETMKQRVALCLRAPVADESLPGDEVPHLREATAVLKQFTKK